MPSGKLSLFFWLVTKTLWNICIHLLIWCFLDDELFVNSKEYPFMVMLSLLTGSTERKKYSNNYNFQKLSFFITAYANGTLMKSWAANPFKFECLNLIKDDFFERGFNSMSSDKTKTYFRYKMVLFAEVVNSLGVVF